LKSGYEEPVVKPWGCYQVLARGLSYLVKELTLTPGSSISLQFHRFRTETWTVTSGRALAICGPKRSELIPGYVFYVPKGSIHRLKNIGEVEDLSVIEIQLGRYLSEDDITRLQDDYGRVDAILAGEDLT